MTQEFTRDFYNEKSYRDIFNIHNSSNQSYRKKLTRFIQPTKKCFANILLKKLPIIQWLPKYRIKENILKDVFAGITIGILQIAPSNLILA